VLKNLDQLFKIKNERTIHLIKAIASDADPSDDFIIC